MMTGDVIIYMQLLMVFMACTNTAAELENIKGESSPNTAILSLFESPIWICIEKAQVPHSPSVNSLHAAVLPELTSYSLINLKTYD